MILTHRLAVIHRGKKTLIEATAADTILRALQTGGFTGLHAPCGGNGRCRQCRVLVTGRVVSEQGETSADNAELFACKWRPAGDCTVLVPDAGAMRVEEGGVANIAPCGEGLGVAVDIGTTTVAVFLYDLASGRRLAAAGAQNEQRAFGADVISRIVYCGKAGGLERLSGVIRRQLLALVDDACQDAGRSRGEIARVTVAGNTVMQHIFAMLDPTGIGVAPFTTVSLFGETQPADRVFSGLAPGAELYLCPAVAGYVGGDITAGLLSSGAYGNERTCLFVDIGTNGEMGIGGQSGFITCATAAGPAFEGAEIECGMGGSPGAIDRVFYAGGSVEYEVIGGGEAAGICGSGIIDALSVMLRCGAVEESGRMVSPEEAPAGIAHRLKRAGDGTMRFYLSGSVFVSAVDVRKIQLAKAAIRAGIETLLSVRGCDSEDIDSVLIAGGFGAHMDIDGACTIGLLPPTLKSRARHIGNSAGAGAALALMPEMRGRLGELQQRCKYLELSSSPLFMEKYIASMIFDEADVK